MSPRHDVDLATIGAVSRRSAERGAAVPGTVRTDRLLLRCWHPDDATSLLPILEANQAHLANWIPAAVATPAPLPLLALRLAGYAADFRAGNNWRFGMFSPDGVETFGEVSLFPRNETGRVPLREADRLEIGYWLRADATGRGYASEASRAMISLAGTLPGVRCVEIRCDSRNQPSAAIPQRLGFRLTASARDSSDGPGLMVWALDIMKGSE